MTSEQAFDRVEATSMAWIDADAMREVDRVMVDDLGIALLQMMENAGRAMAQVVRRVFSAASVTVLAGNGGNGGGGLAAARHLTNAGVDVRVVLSGSRGRLSEATSHQLATLEAMGLDVDDNPGPNTDIVIDAMVGYSLTGPLRGRAAELTRNLIERSTSVVSLDVPSGTDASTGHVDPGAVVADATVTLCTPKAGLRDTTTVGRLFVADISVPPAVVESLGAGPAPPFHGRPVLEVGR